MKNREKTDFKVAALTPLFVLNIVELALIASLENKKELVSEAIHYYTCEDIEQAVLDNEYLKEKEKDFILKYFKIIIDNIDYIDLTNLYSSISMLKIYYENENNNNYGLGDEIMGAYFYSSNVIRLFTCDSFDKVDEEILLHELCHCFSYNYSKIGSSISEAITEILSAEYCNDLIKCYQYEKSATYALLELIGKEPILQFYFTGNIDYIKNVLLNIIDDEKLADDLINSIDNITTISNEYYNSKKEYKNDIATKLHFNNVNIYNIIDEYFQKKFGYSINDDEVMQSYLVDSGFSNLRNSQYKEIIPKGYFNEEYIKNHNNVIKTYEYSYYTQERLTIEEALEKSLIVMHYESGNIFYTTEYECYIIDNLVMHRYNKKIDKEIIVSNRTNNVLCLKN